MAEKFGWDGELLGGLANTDCDERGVYGPVKVACVSLQT